MTKISRTKLSVLAWTASVFCSVILLISAIAAAEHKRDHHEIAAPSAAELDSRR